LLSNSLNRGEAIAGLTVRYHIPLDTEDNQILFTPAKENLPNLWQFHDDHVAESQDLLAACFSARIQFRHQGACQ
jgi:hypothetical protein